MAILDDWSVALLTGKHFAHVAMIRPTGRPMRQSRGSMRRIVMCW
jgi:hypothetical protein